MKSWLCVLISISVPFSVLSKNSDLKNLITNLHVQTHLEASHSHSHGDKHSHNDHHHDHSHQVAPSKASLSSIGVTHQHEEDSSHGDKEPHKHTFSTSLPLVLYLTPQFDLNFKDFESLPSKVVLIVRIIAEPDLNALFRPPIL